MSIPNSLNLSTTLTSLGYIEDISLSALPKLHQLKLIEDNGKRVKVIETVAAAWERVATFLYIPEHTIRIIKRDYPNQCEVACQMVFLKWLVSTSEDDIRQPVTWDTLINVLTDANFSEVAAELKTVIEAMQHK